MTSLIYSYALIYLFLNTYEIFKYLTAGWLTTWSPDTEPWFQGIAFDLLVDHAVKLINYTNTVQDSKYIHVASNKLQLYVKCFQECHE